MLSAASEQRSSGQLISVTLTTISVTISAQLSTNLRGVSQCPEKTPLCWKRKIALSQLGIYYLRHNAKQTFKYSK